MGDHVQQLRDEVSVLRETSSVHPTDVLQLQEDLLALRSERTALQPGVDMPSMDHVQQLRDEISALRETSSVHPRDVFKLQEELVEVSQSLKYLLADVTSHRERSEKSVREIHEEVAELKVNSGATLSVDETRQAIEAL